MPTSPEYDAAFTVENLQYHQASVTPATLGSEVFRLFEENHVLTGILVLEGKKICGIVARNQFFQRLGRLYGIEIYLPRPIQQYLTNFPDPPLILAHDTPISQAVLICLARNPDSIYNPFAMQMPEGEPRLVDFLTLIFKQSDLLSLAQTEAEAQKSAAITANQAKSEFLANVSHELRTPLTAIIGYSEILIEDIGLNMTTDMTTRLKNITLAGHKLLEMINTILDLSKAESGKMELFLHSFEVKDLIKETLTIAQPLLAKNKNRFHPPVEQNWGEMFSDESKLRQALLNLLSNAAKFTDNGEISLSIETRDDILIFNVRDTGIGMSKQQLDKLFEAFYQADSSISRRYGGTGLGLSLTKKFVEMLGGIMEVESTEQVGTLFSLKVPRQMANPDNL